MVPVTLSAAVPTPGPPVPPTASRFSLLFIPGCLRRSARSQRGKRLSGRFSRSPVPACGRCFALQRSLPGSPCLPCLASSATPLRKTLGTTVSSPGQRFNPARSPVLPFLKLAERIMIRATGAGPDPTSAHPLLPVLRQLLSEDRALANAPCVSSFTAAARLFPSDPLRAQLLAAQEPFRANTIGRFLVHLASDLDISRLNVEPDATEAARLPVPAATNADQAELSEASLRYDSPAFSVLSPSYASRVVSARNSGGPLHEYLRRALGIAGISASWETKLWPEAGQGSDARYTVLLWHDELTEAAVASIEALWAQLPSLLDAEGVGTGEYAQCTWWLLCCLRQTKRIRFLHGDVQLLVAYRRCSNPALVERVRLAHAADSYALTSPPFKQQTCCGAYLFIGAWYYEHTRYSQLYALSSSALNLEQRTLALPTDPGAYEVSYTGWCHSALDRWLCCCISTTRSHHPLHDAHKELATQLGRAPFAYTLLPSTRPAADPLAGHVPCEWPCCSRLRPPAPSSYTPDESLLKFMNAELKAQYMAELAQAEADSKIDEQRLAVRLQQFAVTLAPPQRQRMV